MKTNNINGIIATNTTNDYSLLTDNKSTTGGISGKLLRKKFTEIIKFLRQ